MYVFVCALACTCGHVYGLAHACMYVDVCEGMHMCTCMHVCEYVYACVYMFVGVGVHTIVCVHMSACV